MSTTSTYNSSLRRFVFSSVQNFDTTEFRQYDPRLGRWKSLDPLMAQFPWQSPYCAFDNNPVFYNDPLGLAAKGGDEKEIEDITEIAKKEGKKIIETPEMRVTGKRTFFQKHLKYPIKRFIKNVKAGYLNLGRKVDKFFKDLEVNDKQKNVKDEQNAGSKLVTKEGGPSPVKTKAKFFADIINIESLLIYCGAGQQSLFKDLPTNTDALPDLFDKIKGVLEESKLAEKARKYEDENYGIQSNNGQLKKVTHKNIKDTIIKVTTITRGYGWSTFDSKDTTVKKSEVKNVKQKIVINKF